MKYEHITTSQKARQHQDNRSTQIHLNQRNSRINLMQLTVFWNTSEFIHINFLPSGTKVTTDFQESVLKKRPCLFQKGVTVHTVNDPFIREYCNDPVTNVLVQITLSINYPLMRACSPGCSSVRFLCIM